MSDMLEKSYYESLLESFICILWIFLFSFFKFRTFLVKVAHVDCSYLVRIDLRQLPTIWLFEFHGANRSDEQISWNVNEIASRPTNDSLSHSHFNFTTLAMHVHACVIVKDAEMQRRDAVGFASSFRADCWPRTFCGQCFPRENVSWIQFPPRESNAGMEMVQEIALALSLHIGYTSSFDA